MGLVASSTTVGVDLSQTADLDADSGTRCTLENVPQRLFLTKSKKISRFVWTFRNRAGTIHTNGVNCTWPGTSVSEVTAEIQVFDEILAQTGKKVLSNVSNLRVESVELNPVVDDRLFSNIPFKSGVKVYQIVEGKIVDSYIEGVTSDKATPTPFRFLFLFLLGVNGLVFLGVSFFIFKRRLRK